MGPKAVHGGRVEGLPVTLEEPTFPVVMQTVSLGPRLCENLFWVGRKSGIGSIWAVRWATRGFRT